MSRDISESEVTGYRQDKPGSTPVTAEVFLPSLLHLDRHWNPLRSTIQWVQRVVLAGVTLTHRLLIPVP
jgi:hypothetical protein